MTTEERLLSIVNPGRLNHLATVLQATRSVDARGNWIENGSLWVLSIVTLSSTLRRFTKQTAKTT